MKRYIRTDDGRLFDMEWIKKLISRNSSDTDFTFADELEIDGTLGELRFEYTSKDAKSGETHYGGITLNCKSTEYVEGDDIEELLDGASYNGYSIALNEVHDMSIDDAIEKGLAYPGDPPFKIFGVTSPVDGGVNVVAVMNDGQWELIL